MKAPTRWVAPLVLVATGALLYGGSLDGPFIYDDQLSIVDNPNIRRLWPLTASMGSPYEAPPAGRPLMALSLAINYALGGLEPRGYRLFNLAMHILCSLALYGVGASWKCLVLSARCSCNAWCPECHETQLGSISGSIGRLSTGPSLGGSLC